MPGRHVTDHQMRLFMKHRATDPIPVAAARAGFSAATGYRIAQDPRLPSEKRAPRERRRPDPLAAVFDTEVVPMLETSPLALGEQGRSDAIEFAAGPPLAREGVEKMEKIAYSSPAKRPRFAAVSEYQKPDPGGVLAMSAAQSQSRVARPVPWGGGAIRARPRIWASAAVRAPEGARRGDGLRRRGGARKPGRGRRAGPRLPQPASDIDLRHRHPTDRRRPSGPHGMIGVRSMMPASAATGAARTTGEEGGLHQVGHHPRRARGKRYAGEKRVAGVGGAHRFSPSSAST